MGYRDLFNEWLSLDSDTRNELLSIEDEKEIEDRFYKDLEFGTGGLRGIMGAGSNRMNKYTVARASLGLANYFNSKKKDGVTAEKCKIAIAYDSRNNSEFFAKTAAVVYANNGFEVYLFDRLVPVPVLSFTTGYLGCDAGVMITASHNPKEYNGYKVYQEDGAQISGEISDGILREIQALDLFDSFSRMPLEQGIREQIIRMIGEEMDRRYLDYAEGLKQRPDRELDRSVTVVYTPLNGAGSIPMETAARELGYENFVIVPEQKDPDPDFTTVGYPNPEDPKGFALAEKLGRSCMRIC